MRERKKDESIWHFLSPGLGEFTLPKRELWYEQIPGVMAFPAVTLGKKRKTLFGKTETLVLYRYGDKRDKDTTCKVAWVRASELCERLPYITPKRNKNICHDKELNEMVGNIIKEKVENTIRIKFKS